MINRPPITEDRARQLARPIAYQAHHRQAVYGYTPSAHAVYVQCVRACRAIPYGKRHAAARSVYDIVVADAPAIQEREERSPVQSQRFVPMTKHGETAPAASTTIADRDPEPERTGREEAGCKAAALHQSSNMGACPQRSRDDGETHRRSRGRV